MGAKAFANQAGDDGEARAVVGGGGGSMAVLAAPGRDVGPPSRQVSGETIVTLATVLAAEVWGVRACDLRGTLRGNAHIARARQSAMAALHTVGGLSLTEAGAAFGRDRTTARHAVRVVGDDADPRDGRVAAMLGRWVRQVQAAALALV
jgi:hypothetical protein